MLTVGVAPRNSLRVLRTLRSDSRGEPVHDVRCAHRPRRLRFSAAPSRPGSSRLKASRAASGEALPSEVAHSLLTDNEYLPPCRSVRWLSSPSSAYATASVDAQIVPNRLAKRRSHRSFRSICPCFVPYEQHMQEFAANASCRSLPKATHASAASRAILFMELELDAE
jgi:hypothetical protein